ncbi:MAG TPA: PAS domain-containing protein [Spirochaetota bacterium]|nr:PAS domain-containing protein [Spirochaetota bacterium]
MAGLDNKERFEEPDEAWVILSNGCRIVSYNEEFEKLFGREVIAPGRFCISGLTGDSSCFSCAVDDRGESPEMTLLSVDKEINGKKYRIRFKRILYGSGFESIVAGRIIETAAADAIAVRAVNFFQKYISTLESVKVLPWKLDLRNFKLYNQFNDKLVFEPGLSGVNFEAWLELIHPVDRPVFMPAIADMVKGSAGVFDVEYRITDGKGGWRWLHVNGSVSQSDSAGAPLAANGYVLDITVMKGFEEQIREREQKLRDSGSRLKNAMKLGRMSPWEYIFSTDKIITGRRLSEFWGFTDYYARQEPIGREELRNRIHAEDRPYVMEQFDKAVTKGENFEMVFRIVVDGQVKYEHFIAEVVFENGKPVKLLGVAQDLTTRHMLESNLERKYEGLKFITERIGLGLWDFSVPEMKLYLMSDEYSVEGAGDTSVVITLDDFFKWLHPEDVRRCRQWFDRLTGGADETGEIELRYKIKSDYRWFRISAVINSRDIEGKPLTLRGLFQDVTERKEIETKLYQSQKMEAIGRLAGGVAHDFNNILQVIMGYGSLALMDVDNESEMFEYISNIVDSGEKARNLVRQLLLFARKEKFKPELVYPNDLIKGLTKMLKRVIGENISLDFIPGDEARSIFGDSGQLEQVIMNLCINARDAAEGTGSIVIKTKDVMVDEPWPCFDSIIPAGEYFMISVTDSGMGIPPENLDRIFEPFFTTKGKHSGTGLGLATTYAIVKQHRGYIDLHSIVGKGSTFSVYLPAYMEGADIDQAEDQNQFEDDYSGKGTILVAEDDELIRKYTCRILEDSGFSVITASNGLEAVELYKKNIEAVDLLLLDIIMPRMNGWDVYNTIRGPELKLPVVFFSGYDENLLPGNFKSDMPMRYVQKPFKYYTLIKAIQELMEQVRS